MYERWLALPLKKTEEVLRPNSTHTFKAFLPTWYHLINMLQLASVSLTQDSLSGSSYPSGSLFLYFKLLSQILIYSDNPGAQHCAPSNITLEKAKPISDQATFPFLVHLKPVRCHGGWRNATPVLMIIWGSSLVLVTQLLEKMARPPSLWCVYDL